MLKFNKILATIYVIGLGVGETVMNWGNWQYAPLWIVDYMIVAALLFGVFAKTSASAASRLKCAWVFAFAIMYMALFVSIDSDAHGFYEAPREFLAIVGALMGLAIVGFVLSVLSENPLLNSKV